MDPKEALEKAYRDLLIQGSAYVTFPVHRKKPGMDNGKVIEGEVIETLKEIESGN